MREIFKMNEDGSVLANDYRRYDMLLHEAIDPISGLSWKFSSSFIFRNEPMVYYEIFHS